MRCPGCGARVGERDRACFVCQRSLTPAPAAAASPVAASAVAQSRPVPGAPPPVRTTTAAQAPVRSAGTGPTFSYDRPPPAAPPPAPTAPLELDIAWGRERRSERVPTSGATIGSTERADIRLQAPFLAPVHVRLRPAPASDPPGAWAVEATDPTAVVLHRGITSEYAVVTPGEVFRIADRIGNVVTIRTTATARPSLRESGLRSLLPAPGESYLIGSDPSCAVRLQHTLVQPRHAALRSDDGGSLWLEDRGTSAGTYVNGRRLRGRQRLQGGDVVQIGPFSATVGTVALEPLVQVSGVDIEARNAVVTAGARTLLHDVSLHLEPASLTALVGPSGAGKTTMMRLLSGQLAPSHGLVAYNGVDLGLVRQGYAELTGFVPQDDVVHLGLTVTEALTYQARLRLGTSVDSVQRTARVEELLVMLGLSDQREQLVSTLSGGQRKRVSIAVELLKEPQLLFLDEPTSGLDPGLDKRMMLLLRLLADQGRTVLLTTHAIAHVDVCDNLVLLAPGGHLVHAGAPDDASRAFGVGNLGDVFSLIDDPATAAAAARAAAAQRPRVPVQPGGTARTGVRSQVDVRSAQARPVAAGPPPGSAAWRRVVLPQARIFASRHLRLLARDRSASAFTLLQGVVVALLTALVAPRPFQWATNSSSVVFVLGCAAVWFGMISAVRELVKERVIWRREFSSGADLYAYLSAKLAVLSAVAFVQALSLTLVVALLLGMPRASPIGPPFLAVLLTVFLADLCGVALGLVVSAGATNADRALSLVPYLLIGQLVLCGVLFHLGSLTFVSWLVPARWAVSALGGVAGLSAVALHQSSGLYPSTASGLAGTWLVLALLTLGGVAGTALSLHRTARSWAAGLDEAPPLLGSLTRAVRHSLATDARQPRSQV